MTIDLVLPFFDFGTPAFGRLVGTFRERIFEEVAASTLPGLLFTYVWALNDPGDSAVVDAWCAIFRRHGWQVSLVELAADQSERLKRNQTDFRLAHKPSKRDLAHSQQNLLDLDRAYTLNSTDQFAERPNYVKLDTTALSAEESATRIIAALGLPELPAVEETGP